jgi:shikimate kinase
MGAGKTTVGRALGKRLRRPFYDLDDVIEQREGRSIPQIFASAGEPGFRQAETAALNALLQGIAAGSDLVLALGGGAFVQQQNRVLLEQAGAITILLEAPLDELRQRCQAEHKVRPLAQHEEKFAALYALRQPEYQRSQHRVQTAGKPVEQVAAEIETLLKLEVSR